VYPSPRIQKKSYSRTLLDDARQDKKTKKKQIDKTIKTKKRLLSEFDQIAEELKTLASPDFRPDFQVSSLLNPLNYIPIVRRLYGRFKNPKDKEVFDLIERKSMLILKNMNKRASMPETKSNFDASKGIEFQQRINWYGMNLLNPRYVKSMQESFPGTEFVGIQIYTKDDVKDKSRTPTWNVRPTRQTDLTKTDFNLISTVNRAMPFQTQFRAPRTYNGIVYRIYRLLSSSMVSFIVFDIGLYYKKRNKAVAHKIGAIYNPITQNVEVYDPNGDAGKIYRGLMVTLRRLFNDVKSYARSENGWFNNPGASSEGLLKDVISVDTGVVHSTILKHGERCEKGGICSVVTAIIIRHRLKFPFVEPKKSMEILKFDVLSSTGKRRETLNFARAFASSYGAVQRDPRPDGYTAISWPGRSSSLTWSDEFGKGIPKNLPSTVQRSYRLRNTAIPVWKRPKGTPFDIYPDDVYPQWKG
jgi:hypothetical protein